VRRLLGEFKSSERHVCELMAVPRSSSRYRSRRDDRLVQERLRELAREHPRFGYRGLHLYLYEIVTDHDGDTFRAVYTVRFARAVYVLHAFQKKSPRGIKTRQSDIDLVHDRLKMADRDYKERYDETKP
jgi:phage-related protein